MLTFKTRLNGRSGREIHPTADEAAEMRRMGFRFSIHEPSSGEIRLSLPSSVVIIAQRDELIFEQP